MPAKGTIKIKWTQDKIDNVRTLLGQGLIHEEIAAVLGIDSGTLYHHRRKNDQLEQAFKDGRAKAKALLLNSVFVRATKEKGPAAQRAGEWMLSMVHGMHPNSPGGPVLGDQGQGQPQALPAGQTIDVQAVEEVRELDDAALEALIRKLGGKLLD